MRPASSGGRCLPLRRTPLPTPAAGFLEPHRPDHPEPLRPSHGAYPIGKPHDTGQATCSWHPGDGRFTWDSRPPFRLISRWTRQDGCATGSGSVGRREALRAGLEPAHPASLRPFAAPPREGWRVPIRFRTLPRAARSGRSPAPPAAPAPDAPGGCSEAAPCAKLAPSRLPRAGCRAVSLRDVANRARMR